MMRVKIFCMKLKSRIEHGKYIESENVLHKIKSRIKHGKYIESEIINIHNSR